MAAHGTVFFVYCKTQFTSRHSEQYFWGFFCGLWAGVVFGTHLTGSWNITNFLIGPGPEGNHIIVPKTTRFTHADGWD